MLWPANSSWGLNVLFEHTTHTEMNWSWKLLLHHCIKCLWITHPKSSPACSLLFSLCYILLTANCAARKKNYKFALNLPNESYTDNAVTLKLSRAYKFSYFLSTFHSPSVPQSPCFFFFPSPSGQNPRLYTAFIQKLPDHFNIPFFSSLYSPSSKTYLQNRANRDAMNSKYLGFFSWPLFALFDRL